MTFSLQILAWIWNGPSSFLSNFSFAQTLDLSSNMALDTETALLLAKGRKYLNKNFEF